MVSTQNKTYKKNKTQKTWDISPTIVKRRYRFFQLGFTFDLHIASGKHNSSHLPGRKPPKGNSSSNPGVSEFELKISGSEKCRWSFRRKSNTKYLKYPKMLKHALEFGLSLETIFLGYVFACEFQGLRDSWMVTPCCVIDLSWSWASLLFTIFFQGQQLTKKETPATTTPDMKPSSCVVWNSLS